MKKRGLIHIYTGEGKGKTTASLGLAIRAAGHGFKVLFVQFFKEESADSGELFFLREAKPGIEVIRSNCRHPVFTKNRTDAEALRRAISGTFESVKKRVGEGGVDLLVLDEVMSAVKGGWISVDDLIGFIEKRPSDLEIVLTGREAPPELVKIADYVTEMLKIKHPFDRGVPARKGVEY